MRRCLLMTALSVSCLLLACADPERDWQTASQTNTHEALASFVERHPNNPHAAEAGARIEALDWAADSTLGTRQALSEFLRLHPGSPHAREARNALDLLDVVVEAADIFGHLDVVAEGTVTVRPAGGAARVVSVEGSYRTTGSQRLEQDDSPWLSLGLVPGVHHRFVGHVKWPGPSSSFARNGQIISSGSSDASGRFMCEGPIRMSQTITFASDTAATLFDIDADTGSPLVLKVTDRGYRYVSGTGTVRTPKGVRYSYPPEGVVDTTRAMPDGSGPDAHATR